MGKTYRTGMPHWHFRSTLLEGEQANQNYREGVADLPSRASLRRRRESRKVAEHCYHTKPEARGRVHRRKVDVSDL
eukprot:CAMPEP_0182556718 /NCGR_PEP_ID=MMETSP1324-20130603/891_1 /TAXON_ID=236786 /ORGANISM="Florenciella sp., Strain RCC1587" /LENGTH=75 /DNA_ID=CAMNT_0024768655 /DNA_START=46 /DNA_END=273 /DNA_ORIENTATION=+